VSEETNSHNAQHHRQTDRQTDNRTMSIANHTVAVRSAENGTLGIDRLFTDINIAGKRDHWPASEDISLHVTLPYLTFIAWN